MEGKKPRKGGFEGEDARLRPGLSPFHWLFRYILWCNSENKYCMWGTKYVYFRTTTPPPPTHTHTSPQNLLPSPQAYSSRIAVFKVSGPAPGRHFHFRIVEGELKLLFDVRIARRLETGGTTSNEILYCQFWARSEVRFNSGIIKGSDDECLCCGDATISL